MEHPKRIGKYELTEFLGGGMSHVYKAWDPVVSRTVAVKILTDEGAADSETKARFLREAQTAGGLSHDNVIRVYDFGEDAGRPFMVMEFLEGGDLRQSMQSGRVGDFERRVEIALETAKALEYIHAQSIVHRDIKPENIHLDQHGRVRLMDFGIAKRPDLNLTRTGFALGTPYYMAPEQVRGEQVSRLADVYSFGVLLYELFGGDKPFQGDTIEHLFYRILNEPPDVALLRTAGVPPHICSLIERCMAKLPADRPQGFSEVRKQLAGPAKPPKPVPAPRVVREVTPSQDGEPGLPKWLIPAVVLAAIAVVVVIVLATRTPAPGPITGGESPSTVSTPVTPAPPAPTIDTPTGGMILVPAGNFIFGDGSTAHLDAYYVDETEVTNAAYARFCQETGRALPSSFPESRPDYPVVNVTFDDAQSFTRWAGKRLPNAMEWEKAARGSDGRPYPWGADNDATRANVAPKGKSAADGLLPVDSFPEGASTCGALQMAGNAWELVNEPVVPSDGALRSFRGLLNPPPTAGEPWVTMRGGSFRLPLVENVTWEWAAVPARFKADDIGFRCVKDAR